MYNQEHVPHLPLLYLQLNHFHALAQFQSPQTMLG